MSATDVPHFSEAPNDEPPSPVYLPDREYGLALDALVIACVDVLLVHGETFLLGQRRTLPRSDWWLIGGRMMAGESPLAAVQRKVNEEAGLIITSDRFQFLGAYSTCFAQRSQPPQEHGLHSLNLTYWVPVSTAERQAIVLTAKEYADYHWFTPTDIRNTLQGASRDGLTVMDACLQQVLRDAYAALGWTSQ
ncbi:MAG: NUDIX hydrolase [Cyanobacteria bacterium P01_H01_bin.58]